MAGTLASLFNVLSTLCKYASFPTLTKITVYDEQYLTFPGLAFCNMNRVHCSNLVRRIEAVAGGGSDEDIELYNTLCEIFILTDCENSDAVIAMNMKGELQQLCPLIKTTGGVGNFSDLFLDLPIKERRAIGHTLNETVRHCSIGKTMDCLPLLFSVSSTTCGNMFTLNWMENSSSDILISRPGPEFGLELELYLSTLEFESIRVQ